MANPFGEVVDNYKLDDLPELVGKVKTQEDRARMAVRLDNENGKITNAETYVRGLGREYGSGSVTHVLVYNATGDTLRFVDTRNYGGGWMGRTPYPLVIGNGQWASFLHVTGSFFTLVSSAGVVYRGKNTSGQERDFYISWRTTNPINIINTVLCEVGAVDTFQSRWDELNGIMVNSHRSAHSVNKDGVIIEIDIGSGITPYCRAILKIPIDR